MLLETIINRSNATTGNKHYPYIPKVYIEINKN